MSATLAGTWELIRAEQDGADSPELVALKIELELMRGTYLVRFAGQIVDRGTYTIDARDMKITGTEGPNKGRTIPCIFQLTDDRLHVCYGMNGVPPAEFATVAGQPIYLATYRRCPDSSST